jgi:hypothetical protein
MATTIAVRVFGVTGQDRARCSQEGFQFVAIQDKTQIQQAVDVSIDHGIPIGAELCRAIQATGDAAIDKIHCTGKQDEQHRQQIAAISNRPARRKSQDQGTEGEHIR